jgi:chromosomal replication initiation ATPase DnaA
MRKRRMMMDIDVNTLVILIKAAAAADYGVSINDIDCSGRRGKAICSARWLAQYLVKTHTTLSYPAVAAFFGTDQSSIRYGIRKIERNIYTDPELLRKCVEYHHRINRLRG